MAVVAEELGAGPAEDVHVDPDGRTAGDTSAGGPAGGPAGGAHDAGFGGCSGAERHEAVEQLSALLWSVQAQLLEVAVAGADAADWVDAGASSVSGWLSQAAGVSQSTATEWLRVGRALRDLPVLRAAFSSGRLSWDKVRHAVRFADPETEAGLVDDLMERSADEVRLLAAEHATVTRKRAKRDWDQASVRFRRDEEHRGSWVSGWLPGDVAARVEKGMAREADALGPDPESGVWAPLEQRQAQVLDAWASRRLAEDPDRDRTTLLVSVRAGQLAGVEGGNAVLEDDIVVGLHTVLRLACEARVEFQVENDWGTVLGIRRVDREPPPAMRRALRRRDRRCRFPGCGRQIRHFHHMHHWTKGGMTDADNLLGLCWVHHHLVHEGGWTVTGNADRTVVFRSPTGRTVSSDPPHLRPDVARRARRAARAHR